MTFVVFAALPLKRIPRLLETVRLLAIALPFVGFACRNLLGVIGFYLDLYGDPETFWLRVGWEGSLL